MDTLTQAQPETQNEQKVRPVERTEADYLRMAADRRERRGEPVTALLFRNEAYRLELSVDSERPL